MKIINNTGGVVTAYTNNCSVEIAINGTEIVPNELLIDCGEMFFKYFSLKNAEITSGWEKGISRYYYLYNKQINIPTITRINITDIDEIILEKNETKINVVIIKTMCVKNVLCKTNDKKIENQRVSFLNSHIRKKLLMIMIPKLVILFLLSIILALTVVIAEGTLGTNIAIASISLILFLWWLYSIVIFTKIKHYENNVNNNKTSERIKKEK